MAPRGATYTTALRGAMPLRVASTDGLGRTLLGEPKDAHTELTALPQLLNRQAFPAPLENERTFDRLRTDFPASRLKPCREALRHSTLEAARHT